MKFNLVVHVDFPESLNVPVRELETVISEDESCFFVQFLNLFKPTFKSLPRDSSWEANNFLFRIITCAVVFIEEFSPDQTRTKVLGPYLTKISSMLLLPCGDQAFGLHYNKELVLQLNQSMNYKITLRKRCEFVLDPQKSASVEILRIGQLELPVQPLYCVQFLPALNFEGQSISVVHFTKIFYNADSIELYVLNSKKLIMLPFFQSVTMHFMKPSNNNSFQM